nr:hypothetical protein [Devosia submarina]
MGQDEDWAVEWRLVAPPALPVRIVGKVVKAELASAHDLSTDILEIGTCIGVIDAGGAGT